MAEMKRLAKETAIYGVSSILGRFLNWCLVPFYTFVLGGPEKYGVVANVYAWTALLLVILTYGMETGFFRFANKPGNKPEQVYSTSLTCLGVTSVLFLILFYLFLPSVAGFLKYDKHPEYLWMMAFTVAVDAFSAIPFAWLRFLKRPILFASLRILMIVVNIFFNLFFLWICPMIDKANPDLIAWFYDPDYKVGYVFVANVISSVIGLIALAPFFIKTRWDFSMKLLKDMLRYSAPLLILGIAGIMNQSLDKIILPYLYENTDIGNEQLGIYTACFKLGIIMMMFTQAFRYAYEPFVFSKQRDKDSSNSYAEAMKYYLIFSVLVFLGVMFYLDVLKYLLDVRFHEGLVVVPIVLLCYIFQGITFNLSFWYKLTDKTNWGAYISLIGLVITVAGNVLLVPVFGYIASAWSSFVCFLVMMIVSWSLGQKYYPIDYNLKRVGKYVLITGVLYVLGMYIPINNLHLRIIYRTILLGLFVVYILKSDIPAGSLSFLSRKQKKTD